MKRMHATISVGIRIGYYQNEGQTDYGPAVSSVGCPGDRSAPTVVHYAA